MSVNIVTLISVEVSGRNGVGAISAPGLKVGDRVIAVHQPLGGIWQAPGAAIEPFVSVDDEIQQVDAIDESATTFQLTLIR